MVTAGARHEKQVILHSPQQLGIDFAKRNETTSASAGLGRFCFPLLLLFFPLLLLPSGLHGLTIRKWALHILCEVSIDQRIYLGELLLHIHLDEGLLTVRDLGKRRHIAIEGPR